MLTEADCKTYARWWYQACLDDDWDWKQMAALRPDLAGYINTGFLQTRALTEANIIKELNSGDISRVVLQAEEALTEDGRAEDADENSAEFRRMCAYMLRGALEATRKAKAEEAGDFTYEPTDPLFKAIPIAAETPTVLANAAPPVPPPPVPTGPTIESLVEPFVTEKAGAKLSRKSLSDYRATLGLFMQVVGPDRPVAAITGRDVVAFKDLLRACPTNFRKRLGTDDLREAVRLNAERPESERLAILEPKTINEKYLSNLKAFFDWARENRHIEESPASGVRVQRSKKQDAVEERHPFSVIDLRRILAMPNFTETPPDQRGYRFWAPVVALFTGCRLNEIGQLQTGDIVELHGMLHFAIRDEGDDQRLKSAAAHRWIPVHPELVALGFLEYVRRQGTGRLFPDWRLSADGYYSSSYSKWFGRLLKAAGVKTDKKTFHSFRHTVADALDEVVEGSVRDKFLGHASGNVRDRYGSKPPKQLWSEGFNRLSYPGLDLSHLRP